MIIIQKFQANNHLAVIFPLVVASAAVNCETSTPLSSQTWQKITDPALLRHRERSVAIHLPTLRSSVIASEAWRSVAQTHDTVRVWTATSAVSPLAVTENKRLVSSGVQPSDPSLRIYGLPLKGLDCHLGMEPPRSDGK